MEEKARSNPFSISNILSSASSREQGRKDSDESIDGGETHEKHRLEFSRAFETRRQSESSKGPDRRMSYDFDEWSRTSVEGWWI